MGSDGILLERGQTVLRSMVGQYPVSDSTGFNRVLFTVLTSALLQGTLIFPVAKMVKGRCPTARVAQIPSGFRDSRSHAEGTFGG